MRDGTELEVKVRLGEPSWSRRRAAARWGCGSSRTTARPSPTPPTSRRRRWSGSRARRSRWRRWPSPIPTGDAAGARGDGARGPRPGSVGRRRCSRSTWPRGCGGRAPARRRRCKLDARVTNSEGRDLRAQRRRVGLRDVGGVLGIDRGTHVSFVGRADLRRRRRARSATALLDRRRASRRRCSIPEAVGLEAARRTRGQAGRAQDPDLRGAGRLLARGGRAACSASWRASSPAARSGARAPTSPSARGRAVASPLVELVDDPLLRRGPGSRPYDGEGLASRTNVLVSEGRAADVPLRRLRRAQARAALDRLGGARHRRRPARRDVRTSSCAPGRRRPPSSSSSSAAST